MAKQTDSAPEFVKYIGPVIEVLSELGGSGRPDEVRSAIAKAMRISEEEQSKPLPSGVQSRFENQVHWARFYLAKAGSNDSANACFENPGSKRYPSRDVPATAESMALAFFK